MWRSMVMVGRSRAAVELMVSCHASSSAAADVMVVVTVVMVSTRTSASMVAVVLRWR